jgi:hypothetical protein
MNYNVEIGSDAMIHIPSFIKFGSGIQKSLGGVKHTRRHRQHSDF